jgi:hypothetical protein
MSGQTMILSGQYQRELAKKLIDRAPPMAVLNIREATRTTDQNSKMWAMLSDISRAKPLGRCHTADRWKVVMMQACGHAVQFETALDGAPFPVGYSTSRMTKEQMSDLIEFMYAFGAEHGIEWSDEKDIRNVA